MSSPPVAWEPALETWEKYCPKLCTFPMSNRNPDCSQGEQFSLHNVGAPGWVQSPYYNINVFPMLTHCKTLHVSHMTSGQTRAGRNLLILPEKVPLKFCPVSSSPRNKLKHTKLFTGRKLQQIKKNLVNMVHSGGTFSKQFYLNGGIFIQVQNYNLEQKPTAVQELENVCPAYLPLLLL